MNIINSIVTAEKIYLCSEIEEKCQWVSCYEKLPKPCNMLNRNPEPLVIRYEVHIDGIFSIVPLTETALAVYAEDERWHWYTPVKKAVYKMPVVEHFVKEWALSPLGRNDNEQKNQEKARQIAVAKI